MTDIHMPHFKVVYRVLLWFLLIGLTIWLILSPVSLSPLNSNPVESVSIFNNLTLFTALFFVWMLLLLILLFTEDRESKSPWKRLALLMIFATVYLGFWTVITPLGRGDVVSNLGHVKFIQEHGSITTLLHHNLTGFDFPGIFFVILSASIITGFDIFQITSFLLIFCNLLLVGLLYVLFLQTLKNSLIASLAALLAIMSNIILTGLYSLHAVVAIPLLICFLIIINKQESSLFSRKGDIALVTMFFASAVMTHFVTSHTFIFILLGIYITHRLLRRRLSIPIETISLWIIVIPILFSLAYQYLWAERTLKMLISFIPILIEDLLSGQLLLTMTMLFKANIGGSVPLWASIVRSFWLVSVYISSTLIAIIAVVKVKKSSSVEIKEIGGLIGIILLTLLAILLSPRGNQFHRFIMYGSFFSVPIIFRFFLDKGKLWSENYIALLAVVCLLLSFPTFISHNGSISTAAFYPHEAAAGEFLERTYGEGDNLSSFSISVESGPKMCYYYIPETAIKAPPLYTYMENERGLWAEMEWLWATFRDWKEVAWSIYPNWGGNAIFIHSDIMKMPYQHLFDVPLNHPKWIELEDQISNGSKVYNNGDIRIYVSR